MSDKKLNTYELICDKNKLKKFIETLKDNNIDIIKELKKG